MRLQWLIVDVMDSGTVCHQLRPSLKKAVFGINPIFEMLKTRPNFVSIISLRYQLENLVTHTINKSLLLIKCWIYSKWVKVDIVTYLSTIHMHVRGKSNRETEHEKRGINAVCFQNTAW